jgi:hypothetical protein
MGRKKWRSNAVELGWKNEPLSELQFLAEAQPAAMAREIESCLAQLADLSRVPALQRPELADFRAELERKLRAELKALHVKRGALADALLEAARADGVSRQARTNRRGKSGHGDVTRPRLTPEQQDGLARRLRKRHPADRVAAGKAWMKETGLSRSTWLRCLERIGGWPAESEGRPKKCPTRSG